MLSAGKPPAYSVPGKIFLLGEYAVLRGRPAAVAAVPFQARVPGRFQLGEGTRAYAAGSPAGRLLLSCGGAKVAGPRGERAIEQRGELEEEPRCECVNGPQGELIYDPFDGRGGFGASTAEFALLYRARAEARRWPLSAEGVWRKYRELTAGEPTPPSGADLFAQWAGGTVLFDPARPTESSRISPRKRIELLVLSAGAQPGRKVATHEHLSASLGDGTQSPARDFRALDAPLERGITALHSGDAWSLGRAFSDYGDALRGLGFEIAETSQDREVLGSLPGVLGIKGAGALQADALVAVLEPGITDTHRHAILAECEKRKLVPIFTGWPEEEGVRCDR